MDHKELIDVAREAGFDEGAGWGCDFGCNLSNVERFAALVAKAERDACEKAVKALIHGNVTTCAAAIRQRGEK